MHWFEGVKLHTSHLSVDIIEFKRAIQPLLALLCLLLCVQHGKVSNHHYGMCVCGYVNKEGLCVCVCWWRMVCVMHVRVCHV